MDVTTEVGLLLTEVFQSSVSASAFVSLLSSFSRHGVFYTSAIPEITLLCFDLLTRPKMPFKVMHRKEVTHSNGSYERKSRGRKLADEMGRARKIPMVHYRVMHRKRVTSELHDSYFRLMTIKHSISKIEWASNDYIIELSSTSQSSCQESSRQLEKRCGRESHTRLRGPSETPMDFGVKRRC